jgi:hypothetical protein
MQFPVDTQDAVGERTFLPSDRLEKLKIGRSSPIEPSLDGEVIEQPEGGVSDAH